ncbi:hypothetical protein ABFX02_10G137600 [Erythranthe guttata]
MRGGEDDSPPPQERSFQKKKEIIKKSDRPSNRAAAPLQSAAAKEWRIRVNPKPVKTEEISALAEKLKGLDLSRTTAPELKKFRQKSKVIPPRRRPRHVEIRRSFPIYKLKNELVQAVHDNQVLVVIGETGSGKTTQLTQYLADTGIYTTDGKKIGCTQPRRVAAISVAKRVAEEFGSPLGREVGYTIRFEDRTSPNTIIKYMTDGMLLREIFTDKELSNYSVIILDEAHERTIHTDVLFVLLKELLERRPDLRLVVTSATLDAEKFSGYFSNCRIFRIPGRIFPVKTIYVDPPDDREYVDLSLDMVLQIHATEPEGGDILVFLTGQEDIDYACQSLHERMEEILRELHEENIYIRELIILPVYSALPNEIQSRIFEPAPPGKRKVVFATNIAEASLTIDGIFYVIDCGLAKQNVYNYKRGIDSLATARISQASAQQRKGRAGRTGPGKCFRLYTESTFLNEMGAATPEIQRINLCTTALNLKSMGIKDLVAPSFDFMDPPPPEALTSAIEQLRKLGALDKNGVVTNLGKKMAEFPLDPPMSKMLIASVDLGCSDEILTITAMIQTGNIFYRPRDRQDEADKKKEKFIHPSGDHLTLLTVYELWKKAGKFSGQWCYDNFVQSQSLRTAHDARKQLASIMERLGLGVVSCGKDFTRVRKAVAVGFCLHAAKKDTLGRGYVRLVDNRSVYLHPSSSLFTRQATMPEWVVYNELVMTTKVYMREVSAVDPKWISVLTTKSRRAS